MRIERNTVFSCTVYQKGTVRGFRTSGAATGLLAFRSQLPHRRASPIRVLSSPVTLDQPHYSTRSPLVARRKPLRGITAPGDGGLEVVSAGLRMAAPGVRSEEPWAEALEREPLETCRANGDPKREWRVRCRGPRRRRPGSRQERHHRVRNQRAALRWAHRDKGTFSVGT